jgi:Carboxypeptidase regulatory-like domain
MIDLNDTTLMQISLLRGGRISGTVRSAEEPGTFIEGARISIEGMNDVMASSGADGMFTLRNVPAGDSLIISVSRVGYMTRRISGILLAEGERRSGVDVAMSRAVLSSLYGFQVEVDSVRDAGNGTRLVSGSIVNIPGNGVVELQERGTRISFENLEIDANSQPTRGYVELMTRSLGVLLYGIPSSLRDTSEAPLRLMPSQTGIGVIRATGGAILFREHPVSTDLAGSRWPDEIAFDKSGSHVLGLWADSTYHGPTTIALRPVGTIDSTTLFGYRVRVDYGAARVDSSGLHYAGMVSIPGIADTTFPFTDLRIAVEPGSNVVELAGSEFREQPTRFDVGEFEFHNRSVAFNAGGFRTAGYVRLPEHGNTQLDFSALRLSPDGGFRAMEFFKPVNDSLTFGKSRFAVSEVRLAPDSAGKKALLFSGELVVRAFQLFALRNMFSKPIVFSTLRYDQDGRFNGTTKFNQDVIFLAIFNVKVNNVEFTNDQHGNYIHVDGGIALVIPGLNVHGGNFRFYEDGKFVLDTVGLKFQSPLFTVSGFYVYNDSIGIGGGVELLINPVLYLAASFNYKDATHWGFAITGGRGGPAGGGIQMGVFNLYRVGGKLARSGDAWTVGINCAMAIAKPGVTPVKLEPMGIEVTAGGPGGPIITGFGKLVPDSPDTTVKLWKGSLDVRITYDHPQRKFTGSATLQFVRDWKGRDIVTLAGVLALEIKGRTDGGSGVERWYLGGSASAKFLAYEVGNATFAIGQNFSWPHTFEVIYHPDNPVINGIHLDMYVGIPDLNFVIWGARFHYRTFVQMTLGGDPSLSGGMNLHASTWFDMWVIRGYASVDFEAGLRYSDCVSFSATAAFRMGLYTGCCGSGCSWGVCLACQCKWSKPWCCVAPCGAKACFNVGMNVGYNRDNCDQGWRFAASW